MHVHPSFFFYEGADLSHHYSYRIPEFLGEIVGPDKGEAGIYGKIFMGPSIHFPLNLPLSQGVVHLKSLNLLINF